MAMSVEIYKPTADELNGPALGGYLVIHGKIHDAIQLTGIDVLFDGEFANVVLNERQWTASRRVRKSGNCTITARSYLYVTTGPEYSPWASLTVVVAPTQWPPITVEVNDPPVAAAEARVEVLPTGKLLAVRARATVPRKSVKVSTSIDNYTRVWDLSPPEPGPWWNGDVMIPGVVVPFGHKLVVSGIDFFDQRRDTDYTFWTLDVTPPKVIITEPNEDQVFVTPSVPFQVTFRGDVSDTQSQYKPATLKYSFAGQLAFQSQ